MNQICTWFALFVYFYCHWRSKY